MSRPIWSGETYGAKFPTSLKFKDADGNYIDLNPFLQLMYETLLEIKALRMMISEYTEIGYDREEVEEDDTLENEELNDEIDVL